MKKQQTTMTSVALQHKHTGVYKDFFHQHSLVVSTSHVLRRGPSISRATASLKLKQKLPARMYLGVTFRDDETISIKNIITYDQIRDEFTSTSAKQVISNSETFEVCVRDILRAQGYKKGCDITILSEYGRGHGFGFAGILSTLLASMIYVLLEKVDIGVMRNSYTSFIETSDFHDMCLLAAAIDTTCMGKKHSSSPYISLQEETLPLIHFGHPVTQDPVDIICDEGACGDKFISEQKFVSITDVADVDRTMHLPIDYGVIYFGTPHDSRNMYGTYEDFSDMYSQTNTFLKEMTESYGVDMHEALERTYDIHNLTTFFSVRMLAAWKNILHRPFDKYTIWEFIQTFVDGGLYNSLIEREYKNITDMYFLFDKIKQFDEEKIGLIPLSSGKYGGSFLFVTQYQKSRDTLGYMLEELQVSGYDRVCFEYLSWRDGQSHVGLTIDQYLSENIFSKYIMPDNVLFLDGGGECRIGNHGEILEKSTAGIVLDNIYKKVYIDGKKLTHKDLRSQSATVEVLDILLEHTGDYVHNSEFPVSSYSKNKNEMIGKILLPLKTLVREMFDQEIEVECQGSIYDFHVQLKSHHGLLHRIKKVYHAS